MDYQQALDYLYSFLDNDKKPRVPLEFNLPRIAALLRAFGEPQRAFPCVVVAGTKGKGSTCVLIEAIARAAGYRVGLWTSPHLHTYRERIQVNRALISQDALVAQVAAMQPVVAAFDTAQHGALTVFELGFALALRYFAAQRIDLAVLEVGLGGRYDSVNVVTPILSVITSISYDHMAVLGDTLTQIAYEKAGIVKPGVPVITVEQLPEAMETVARVAREVGAPLVIEGSGVGGQGSGIGDRSHLAPDPRPLTPGLRGTFQHENARLAAGAARLLREQGWRIDDDAIRVGLASAEWPGRFEVIPGAPTLLLDGAHNGDSARRLVESINHLLPGRRVVLVLGTMKDKDLDRILPELLPHVAALVLTKSRHPRALNDLDTLAARTTPLLPAPQTPLVLTPDIPEALDEARRLAAPDDLIVVTGSLAVVAAARETLGLAVPD